MIEIGASEAPAVLGCSSFTTPFQLWLEKVGLVERKDTHDEAMAWGTALEQAVGWRIAHTELGRDPSSHELYLPSPASRRYHSARTWQRATPDVVMANGARALEDLAYAETVLIEVKCVVGFPPPAPRVEWVVQCLQQLMVYDRASCCHLICYGALSHARWVIPRHAKAMDRILRAEERFLELIAREEPPPVRGEDATSLWRLWPFVKEEPVRLGVEAMAWDRIAVEQAKAEADAERAKKEARAQIALAIGDRSEGVLPNGARWTYRVSKNGQRPLRRWGHGDE